MALYLVATPIGNQNDITLRGLEILKQCSVIILEEFKESTKILRQHGISGKQYQTLNEHTPASEIKDLLDLCKNQEVALITDCGTPGFCDPGADLVRLCRQNGVPVFSIPGASSLMFLLSLSSERLDQFVFRGFISAETTARAKDLQILQKEKRAIVLMDTPYRWNKIRAEIHQCFSSRKVLITLNSTQDSEQVIECLGKDILTATPEGKFEFMILIYPEL